MSMRDGERTEDVSGWMFPPEPNGQSLETSLRRHRQVAGVPITNVEQLKSLNPQGWEMAFIRIRYDRFAPRVCPPPAADS